MFFLAKLQSFATEESGAVTIDWVVLTAAVVGLGVAIVMSVQVGSDSVAENIEEVLTDANIACVGEDC